MQRRKQISDVSELCDLDDQQIEYLTRGYCFEELLDETPEHPYVPPFESEKEVRAAWERNRSYIMAKCSPGQRPWAWYEFDASEPKLPRESDLAYLTRTGQWRPGEEEAYRQLQGRAHKVIDIEDYKDGHNHES